MEQFIFLWNFDYLRPFSKTFLECYSSLFHLKLTRKFTDLWLMFDLHTLLLPNTAQPNGVLIAMGSPLSPDLISSWWKTSGMPAPISTLMASALISASFKPFKRLKCCNPRYFWGGILNFYTQMMNAPFASNILLLTMLEILKSTSWTMMLSLDP